MPCIFFVRGIPSLDMQYESDIFRRRFSNARQTLLFRIEVIKNEHEQAIDELAIITGIRLPEARR